MSKSNIHGQQISKEEAFRGLEITDTDRLNYLIATEAYFSWSRDSEVCNVWLSSDWDGEPARPAEGYPQKTYYDPREAIDAAMAATKWGC